MCTDAFQSRGVGASAWRMYASGLTHGLVFPDVYYTYILVSLILACTVVKKKNSNIDRQLLPVKVMKSAKEFEQLKTTENSLGFLCVQKWVNFKRVNLPHM